MNDNNIIFTHVNLATMAEGYGIIENAYLRIRDGEIVDFGPMSNFCEKEFC